MDPRRGLYKAYLFEIDVTQRKTYLRPRPLRPRLEAFPPLNTLWTTGAPTKEAWGRVPAEMQAACEVTPGRSRSP